MGRLHETPHLTFDDVLIRPAASSIEPKDASLRAEPVRGFLLDIPVLSAAMDTVSESELAIALAEAGGLAVIHRSCTVEEQVEMVRAVVDAGRETAAACGPFDVDRALALEEAGAGIISIDCAHGHNGNVVASARDIKERLSSAKLIVGNVGTGEAAQEIASFADAVKVGVGPGSICTTRRVSGVGVPQLSAIREAVAATEGTGVPVIADGGIRNSGDIAKAFAAGASGVMLGSLLAGTDEAPGKTIRRDGVAYKEYRGMGSRAVHEKQISSDRYLASSAKPVAEGVEAAVRSKGPVGEVVSELAEGVRIAMGYVGTTTLSEFVERAEFIRVSPASVVENNPHSVYILGDE